MVNLGVNVAVIDNGQVLLIQREDFEVWCLPGGMVESGESLAQAAMREVEEETGLAVTLTRLVGVYSRPWWMGHGYHIVLFAGQPVGGALRPQPGEAIDVRYFDPDKLPHALLWGQKQRIVDVFEGIGGSVARSQQVPEEFGGITTRQELYERRDRSGLSRAEFYRQYVDLLGPEDQQMDVGR